MDSCYNNITDELGIREDKVEMMAKPVTRQIASIDMDDSVDNFDIKCYLDPIPGLSDHPTLQFDRSRELATSYLSKYSKSNPNSLNLKAQHDHIVLGLQYNVHDSARLRLKHLDNEFQMAELREIVTFFINIMD
jgi:hypothetical protein